MLVSQLDIVPENVLPASTLVHMAKDMQFWTHTPDLCQDTRTPQS